MGIQKFILKDRILNTESEKRKIILGAYLILMYICIDVFFFIVNLFNEQGLPESLLVGVLISTSCLLLLRWGKVDAAIIIHLVRCNGFAFYFCVIDFDPLLTGGYLYFVPSSLGALAVFGYRERWKGIGFTLLSFSLFMIAIFDPQQFNPNEAHFYLIVSFMIVLIIGILIVIFFDRMVTSSEEKILTKNSELIKTNKELDRFVYSASHDLRAPLTSMSGLIQLAQRDSAQIPDYLLMMQERVTVMDNYIKEIVEYSRNARLEVLYHEVVLKPLVQELVNALKYSTDISKVQMDVQIDDTLTLKTDESRLRVILNNLISNGFKYQDFTKPNPYLRVNAEIQNKHCHIKISDNGIGIRKEHQIKIFNMFYRANDTVAGSGLGLFIAKETADKLNGRITFESDYGEGTTFTVSLPVNN
ncbi:MAG: HAMP domain-containing histidine kinase [Cyclobacteriaceae bacterium]|nr:HAMP domain-containing histidine kinase [Cyclobacteriaceae bacterium]